MSSRVIAYSVLAILMLGAVGQIAWQFPQLPAEVASHFGKGGEPDGVMSKAAFTMMMLGLTIGMPVFVVGVTYLTRFMPIELVNIPHREYWLHEDRRESSMRYMEVILVWISIATQLLFIGINWLTFQANMQKAALNTTSAAFLIAFYLVAIFGCCGWIFWRFRKPPFGEAS